MPSEMPSIALSQPVPVSWTSDKESMAFETASTRWPRIVQDMADDVRAAAGSAGASGAARDEAKSVASAIEAIKEEIVKDAKLTPITDDGAPDIDAYNAELAAVGNVSWLNCPWLFGECCLYRRVRSVLARSTHWTTHDVFKQQKDSTFAKSKVAVEELAGRYMQLMGSGDANRASDEARKLLFVEMTEIALWGNATDLSLLTKLSLEEIQKLQGKKAIEASQRNIVDNDVDQLWDYLESVRDDAGQIDIVLDNAGFEFFTDVIYAAFLLDSHIARKVVLHVKDFGWFVSDVIPADVDSLFEHLRSKEIFSARKDLDPLVKKLEHFFASGRIEVVQNLFWTTPHPFQRMATLAPELFARLQRSKLVVFKGDLNYRKLTGDGLWPHTTPFQEVLLGLGKGSGVKVLALRTNKADVCVGLPSESKVRELENEAPGVWTRNGKYAVISFNDGQ